MKLKSKYNVGDIVKFYNNDLKEDNIGQIDKVYMEFGVLSGKHEEYMITPIRMRVTYASESLHICKSYIKEKLNKRTFNKEYAKQCAKEMMKSE